MSPTPLSHPGTTPTSPHFPSIDSSFRPPPLSASLSLSLIQHSTIHQSSLSLHKLLPQESATPVPMFASKP
ncbi:hypothetical protein Mapa_011150 [Marchantia paleacea]|nr:hypothetical protein Mapa_011150 [Marchantia paleacea]